MRYTLTPIMAASENYVAKLEAHVRQPTFQKLTPALQAFLRERARRYRFTFQEMRLASEAALDLTMWGETALDAWWEEQESDLAQQGGAVKELLFDRLRTRLQSLRAESRSYPAAGLGKPAQQSLHVVGRASDKNVVGLCPVASEETVCCNLRTIDAVENCGFSCSYCTIQTFYGDEVTVDTGLREKLQNLDLNPGRFYHFGTGQSSDALMWGNRFALLDTLSEFAAENPNILVELKTKSKNVAYFLQNQPPGNVVLSWSLNTPTIIDNEEHFTASLEERLAAARQVADRGIRVAFHFHPIVYYDNWRRGYRDVVGKVVSDFAANEVLFISFGSVTLIKPVVHAIRRRGRPTKMLQMELAAGPKGKLSYPDSVKKELFSEVYRAFAPLHHTVFMYLCMERAELWESTFGRTYKTNEAFELDFGQRVFKKIAAHERT
jgi:spore photoproduct lyase